MQHENILLFSSLVLISFGKRKRRESDRCWLLAALFLLSLTISRPTAFVHSSCLIVSGNNPHQSLIPRIVVIMLSTWHEISASTKCSGHSMFPHFLLEFMDIFFFFNISTPISGSNWLVLLVG